MTSRPRSNRSPILTNWTTLSRPPGPIRDLRRDEGRPRHGADGLQHSWISDAYEPACPDKACLHPASMEVSHRLCRLWNKIGDGPPLLCRIGGSTCTTAVHVGLRTYHRQGWGSLFLHVSSL